jgi:hypothetical protein
MQIFDRASVMQQQQQVDRLQASLAFHSYDGPRTNSSASNSSDKGKNVMLLHSELHDSI